MKKNLTFLTGIVVLITILVAGGCGNRKKQNDSTKEAVGLVMVNEDSTTVRVYLKEKLIGDSMHLLMYNEKKPDCEVIDNLETEVWPGYTVIFMKAHKSNVKEVINILVDENFAIFSKDVKVDSGLYVLKIDPEASYDTIIKYDIEFKVKQDSTTHIIDPYLKVPPKDPTH